MTDRRDNPTQLVLDEALAERAYACQLSIIGTREAVRPLERRRQLQLARLIALTPICRRGR